MVAIFFETSNPTSMAACFEIGRLSMAIFELFEEGGAGPERKAERKSSLKSRSFFFLLSKLEEEEEDVIAARIRKIQVPRARF